MLLTCMALLTEIHVLEVETGRIRVYAQADPKRVEGGAGGDTG